jgi:hypothetical protein
MASRRLDVREAAEQLETTVDAVRKRIQRGSLDSEKVDGTVYVWLDTDQAPGVDGSARLASLVEELHDRVRSLEKMLAEEREVRTEERRRHDTLMAQLMARIPEIDAPRESPESSGPAPADPPTEKRRWWEFWRSAEVR